MRLKAKSVLMIAEYHTFGRRSVFGPYFTRYAVVDGWSPDWPAVNACGVGIWILGFRLALYWRKRA